MFSSPYLPLICLNDHFLLTTVIKNRITSFKINYLHYYIVPICIKNLPQGAYEYLSYEI